MKRKDVLLALAVATSLVFTGAAEVSRSQAKPTVSGRDVRCQRLYGNNRHDPDLDMIMNYHGCDQVYRNGNLIGFGRGDSRCERAAYRGSLVLGKSEFNFHRYMGRNRCVLFEDWSWGDE